MADTNPTPLDVCHKLLDTWKRAGPLGSHQMEKFETVVRMAEMAVDDANQKAREFLGLIPDPIANHHPTINCRCQLAREGGLTFFEEASHDLLAMLQEARREIYLAHSKDGAVYDPTIMSRIDNVINKVTGKPHIVVNKT
ncbi:hypothetical protein M0R72_17695 [Candidatus Pacearchaeota archaeon]|jgi:hypothetical protein|nr:hypothetical protein [Candidatus Pacearchaeota archaeon]